MGREYNVYIDSSQAILIVQGLGRYSTEKYHKFTQFKKPNAYRGYILSSVSVIVALWDGRGPCPGVTKGDIEGLRVAKGERDGEKLGDIAVDVLKPPGSWLMGDRGKAAW